MLIQTFKKKRVTKVKNVVIDEKTICDECGKEIDTEKGYFKLNTFHSDWGTDSGDSYESFDICGGDCLRKRLNTYIDLSGQGRNSQQFQVKHSYDKGNISEYDRFKYEEDD